jgi:murein DD-endopeptidase MepM/ murein hydrolase activator NlpD
MKVVIMPRERVVHGALSFSVGQSLLFGLATLALVLFTWAHLQRVFQPPFAENLQADPHRKSAVHPAPYTNKQALDSLFVQVGVLQANYQRLDALSRRVAGLAGFPVVDLQIISENADITAPRAGGEPKALVQLGQHVRTLKAALVKKTEHFLMLDLMLTKHAAAIARQPTAMPIAAQPQLSSPYGWRRHPFLAEPSVHEGLDFAAPLGTPILAASGGIVRTAANHGGFGNLIEIDHGEGLMTRYAHAKVLLVKKGDLVRRGQMIARVGSTGLSTGPHLHFEVRLHDKPLDPRVYLTGSPIVHGSARVAPVR